MGHGMAGWLFNKRGKRVDEFLCLVETWKCLPNIVFVFFYVLFSWKMFTITSSSSCSSTSNVILK